MPTHSLNDTHLGSINIYLDSVKANVKHNGTENSNCSFFLENVIQAPPDTHILVGLTACQIPVSFYNVTSSNNNLKISGSINGTTTILLPPKNYNTETLVKAVNTALLLDGNDIQMSFDTSAYKFVFSSLTQTLQIQETKLNKELGLPQTSIPTPAGFSFTCPKMCNLSGTQSIYVMLNNLSIESLDSRAGGDLNGVLSKVDVCCSFGEYIEFQQTENQFFMIQDRHISHFNVSLTDDDINPLDMNGIDWSISITCHFSKKRLPTIVLDNLLDEEHTTDKPEEPENVKAKKKK